MNEFIAYFCASQEEFMLQTFMKEKLDTLRKMIVAGIKLTRVFDTCANIEISTSLENRAFFIKKMSNSLQFLVSNFA
ncbi:hypothetical protein Psfp_04302 [Pelotomaculum sp. FP]|nr:hypothetical protein Psfp_04302 [Pelotomaculum sp. FP]